MIKLDLEIQSKIILSWIKMSYLFWCVHANSPKVHFAWYKVQLFPTDGLFKVLFPEWNYAGCTSRTTPGWHFTNIKKLPNCSLLPTFYYHKCSTLFCTAWSNWTLQLSQPSEITYSIAVCLLKSYDQLEQGMSIQCCPLQSPSVHDDNWGNNQVDTLLFMGSMESTEMVATQQGGASFYSSYVNKKGSKVMHVCTAGSEKHNHTVNNNNNIQNLYSALYNL